MEEDKTTQEEAGASKKSPDNDIKDNKVWALLSYLGVLVIVPLIGKTDSPFAQFHAKQGLVILGGWVLSWLPFGFIFAIASLVFSIMGLINVANGEKKKLPFVGDLAEKIKL